MSTLSPITLASLQLAFSYSLFLFLILTFSLPPRARGHTAQRKWIQRIAAVAACFFPDRDRVSKSRNHPHPLHISGAPPIQKDPPPKSTSWFGHTTNNSTWSVALAGSARAARVRVRGGWGPTNYPPHSVTTTETQP